MTIKTDCQCFTCRHQDEPRLVKAYCVGYAEACECFLNWTKRFFVNDGMNLLPIYGIKDEYLLADDWEIVE